MMKASAFWSDGSEFSLCYLLLIGSIFCEKGISELSSMGFLQSNGLYWKADGCLEEYQKCGRFVL